MAEEGVKPPSVFPGEYIPLQGYSIFLEAGVTVPGNNGSDPRELH